MLRLVVSLVSGGLFGAGLFVSGMTDTAKVQGWLDVFGNWDPTLAFVMGGAIIPMIFAWQIARRRAAPLAGGSFPSQAAAEVDHRLIVGSVVFGAGWGLAGLCPGPAVASLSYSGTGGWIFFVSMLGGMALAPRAATQLDRLAAAA